MDAHFRSFRTDGTPPNFIFLIDRAFVAAPFAWTNRCSALWAVALFKILRLRGSGVLSFIQNR